MVAHPNSKGGKRKLSHKTKVNCYLPFQNFQGLAGVDFRSVNFSSLSSFVFLFYCFDCTQTHKMRVRLIVEGVQRIKMATFAGKKLSFRPNNGFFDVFKH